MFSQIHVFKLWFRLLFTECLKETLEEVVKSSYPWGTTLALGHLALVVLGLFFLRERGSFENAASIENEYTRAMAEHNTPFRKVARIALRDNKLRDRKMKKMVEDTKDIFLSISEDGEDMEILRDLLAFHRDWDKIVLKTKSFLCDHYEAAICTSAGFLRDVLKGVSLEETRLAAHEFLFRFERRKERIIAEGNSQNDFQIHI